MKKIRLLIVLLICSFALQSAFAQNFTVSGVVKDRLGKEVPGVSVIIKGTTNGVSTTADGKYSITVPKAGTTLVFSFIGMTTQEFLITKSETINVVLDESANSLNDVVIVGFGTQKRSNVTGSVSTVNNKQLVQTPVGDLSNALAGRTPGVITKQPSGEPGADGTQIYIRGNSTFGGGSMEPLFVIDGVARQRWQASAGNLSARVG